MTPKVPSLAERIADAASGADLGRPGARKAGRNPRFPFQPTIIRDSWRFGRTTEIIPARAFATRDEAVVYAGRYIDRLRDDLAVKLARPGHRALREQYGLPRELS